MASKYLRDLDISLLFVSVFATLARCVCLSKILFSVLGGFILSRHLRVHRSDHPGTPARPHRSDKRPAAPNIAAEYLVCWNRPADARPERPRRCHQSPVHPLRLFVRHIVRGLYRGIGETVDRVLYSSRDVREYRRSREGSPDQIRRISEVGGAYDHGFVARHVAVCAPPFRRRPYRLPLGSELFCGASGVSGHFCGSRVLYLHRPARDHPQRLSVPDIPLYSAPEGPAVVEGFCRVCSC